MNNDLAARRRELLRRRLAAAGLADGDTTARTEVARRPDRDRAPLSPAQRRMWVLHRADPTGAAYNVCLDVTLRGPLDLPAFRAALHGLVVRHEILRTRYPLGPDDLPYQHVDPVPAPEQFPVPLTDLRGHPAAAAGQLIAGLAGYRFDLARDWPIRLALWRTGEHEHRLGLLVHHIAWDGGTWPVIAADLSAGYAAALHGDTPAPPPPVQYGDFAAHWAQRPPGQDQRGYWRRQLAGLPGPLPLPADRPGAGGDHLRAQVGDRVGTPVGKQVGEHGQAGHRDADHRPVPGGRRRLTLDDTESAALRRLAADAGVTPFTVLLAAFGALLHRCTGRTDLPVGTATMNRDSTSAQRLAGNFGNTLVLRVNASGDPTFTELLHSVDRLAAAGFAHQDLPYDQVIADLRGDGAQLAGEAFNVMLLVLAQGLAGPQLPGMDTSWRNVHNGTHQFDLSLEAFLTDDGTEIEATYSAALFSAARVDQLLLDLRRLLAAVAARPDLPLSALPAPGPSLPDAPAANDPAANDPAPNDPAPNERVPNDPAPSAQVSSDELSSEQGSSEQAPTGLVRSDPVTGDPVTGELVTGELVPSDQALADPALGDPALGDPALGDPALGDPASNGPASNGSAPSAPLPAAPPLAAPAPTARVPIAPAPVAAVTAPGGQASRAAARFTDAVRRVTAAMAELLETGELAADADFFALGGNSLLSVRLVARLRAELGADVSLRTVTELRTPQRIAAAALAEERTATWRTVRPAPGNRSAGNGSAGNGSAGNRSAGGTDRPLSVTQHALWFLSQASGPAPDYNVAFARRLTGPLDLPALRAALADLVERHEALRTVIRPASLAGDADDVPQQSIMDTEAALACGAALRVRPTQDLDRDLTTALGYAFDPAAEPAFRPVLFQLGDPRSGDTRPGGAESSDMGSGDTEPGSPEAVLLLLTHHLFADEWSETVLWTDLAHAYQARAAGRAPDFPALPVRYADYARWQRDALDRPELRAQRDFWRTTLTGLPEQVDLPTDRPRSLGLPNDSDAVTITLPRPVAAGLRALAQRAGTSAFSVWHALVALLLFRNGAGADLPLGTPTAGRGSAELERVVGMFVNSVVLRGDLSGNPTFSELVGRLAEVDLAAFAHQDLPFERVVDLIDPPRELGRNPLFQTMVVYDGDAPAPLRLPGVSDRPVNARLEIAKFDLVFTLTDHPAQPPAATIRYRTALFDPATVRRLADELSQLAGQVAADPDRRLARIDHLPPAERTRLLRTWNSTAAPVSSITLPELFAAQASATPDAVAAVCGTDSLTYRELDQRAGRLAAELAADGVGPERVVGIHLDRSLDLVVALLAVQRAGGAFMPLEPSWPRRRIEDTLRTSRPVLLLSHDPAALAWSGVPARTVVPAGTLVPANTPAPASTGDPARGLPALPPVPVDPENLAYVMFTSGSTGVPKGAMIRQRAIANRLLWQRELLSFGPGDAALFKAPFGFDISVNEIFLPLVCGATLVICPPGQEREVDALAELIAARHVTFCYLTSTLLALLLDTVPAERLSCLRHVWCGGEALTPVLFARFRAAVDATMYHGYGPAETTIGVTHEIYRPGHERGAVTIGHPNPNTAIYLLDEWLRPVSVDVPGELYVSGLLLGRGYVGEPRRTAERFVASPFGPPGERLYRTGDLARWRGDGVLEFIGRADNQVKIRGMRVELEEVEAALARHPAVRQAAARIHHGPADRLVGYQVPGAEPVEEAELRAWLAGQVPGHLVPERIITLASLPMLPSGKVDRAALPAPDIARTASRPPSGTAEAWLAGLFAQVLGLSEVGADDDFFALGGDSILSIQLVAAARGAGLRFTVRDVFTAPTVAALAPRMAAAAPSALPDGALPTGATASTGAPSGAELPLSPLQHGLLFQSLADETEADAYIAQLALTLAGDVDPARLRSALEAVIRRHDSLRAAFHHVGRVNPVQVIAAGVRVPWDEVDLSAEPATDRERHWDELRATRRATRFALDRPPLLRATLVNFGQQPHAGGQADSGDQAQSGGQEYRLLLTNHHLLFDGWSLPLLVRDLLTAYASHPTAPTAPTARPNDIPLPNQTGLSSTARHNDTQPPNSAGLPDNSNTVPSASTRLPAPGAPSSDTALSGDARLADAPAPSSGIAPLSGTALSGSAAPLAGAVPLLSAVSQYPRYLDWLAVQDRAAAEAAWRAALDGVTGPTLLADGRDTAYQPSAEHQFALGPDLTGRLTRLARDTGVTPHTVLQSAWGLLLGLVTGESDVLFGSTVSGRPADLPGAGDTVGLFINTVPARVTARPGDGFARVLRDAHARQADLLDHLHLGLADIQRVVGLGELFDTLLVFESYPVSRTALDDAAAQAGLRLSALDSTDDTHYPLTVLVMPGDDLRITLKYRPGVFGQDWVHRLGQRLRALLDWCAAQPDTPLSRFNPLLPGETAAWSAPATAPAEDLLAGFDRSLQQYPDRIALRTADAPLATPHPARPDTARPNPGSPNTASRNTASSSTARPDPARPDTTRSDPGSSDPGSSDPARPDPDRTNTGGTDTDSPATSRTVIGGSVIGGGVTGKVDTDRAAIGSPATGRAVIGGSVTGEADTGGSVTGRLVIGGLVTDGADTDRPVSDGSDSDEPNTDGPVIGRSVTGGSDDDPVDIKGVVIGGAEHGRGVPQADGTLTYAELGQRVADLAERLRRLGAGPERVVGIALRRRPELVISVLATLRVGAAFLPLDPDQPAARLRAMIAEAAPVTVLTTADVAGSLSGQTPLSLVDGEIRSAGSSPSAGDAAAAVDPDCPAYLIYTSGSTGAPKGAAVTRAGLHNRLSWMAARYAITADDVFIAKTPIGFDVSVWELVLPFLVGAQLVLARPDGHRDPAYLAEVIRTHGVTTIHFVPSMLRAFLADLELPETDRTNTPLSDIPLASAPLPGAPVADTPVADTPVVRAPVADIPVADTPLSGMPLAGVSQAGAPVADDAALPGMPFAGVSQADVPVADTPLPGMPLIEVSQADVPVADAVLPGMPLAGVPQGGAPVADSPVASNSMSPRKSAPADRALADSGTGNAGSSGFPRLRRIVCSGEELPADLARRCRELLAAELHNLYGPTEASIDVTAAQYPGHHTGHHTGQPGLGVPIGRAADGVQLRVLDAALRPVPPGVPGELYLGGVQLARGYHARAAMTASRFIADPFGTGSRLYRTGDIVRALADGTLVYLGRDDDQVKVRGVRVEPAESAAVLAARPEVAEAVVVPRPDGPSGTWLVAYVVPHGAAGTTPPLDPERLRAAVGAALPDQFVPGAVVVIDRLPVTGSGKLDRRALPAPARPADTGTRPPRGPAETRLCALFAEVLGLETVSPDGNFFMLGGDSISALRLTSLARAAGLRCTPRQVFEAKTPAALARVATWASTGPVSSGGTGDIPLTPIMYRLLDRGGPIGAFSQSVTLRTPAGLTQAELVSGLHAVVRAHHVLRARLVRATEPWLRVGRKEPAVPLRRIGGVPAAAQLAEAARQVAGDLDPEAGKMLSAVWFDGGPAAPGLLLLVAHHLVIDGVSWRILIGDLADACQGLPVAPAGTSFRAWSLGLRRQAPTFAGELPLWREMLDGPPSRLVSRPLSATRDVLAATERIELRAPAALTTAVLTTLPQALRAQTQDVLLAALAVALARAGEPSPLLRLEGHGREEELVGEADLVRTVGWFTTAFPVRLDTGGLDVGQALDGGPAAGLLVKRVRDTLRALPHRGASYGVLRYLLPRTATALGQLPEPVIGFNYLGRFDSPASGDWSLVPGTLSGDGDPRMPVAHALDVNVLVDDEGLRASLTYLPELIPAEQIQRIADTWLAALRGLSRYGERPDAAAAGAEDFGLVQVSAGQLARLRQRFEN